ncbi:unnamed protein product [Dovyalis caffra]|uniref:F-box domain-containing protein n=1 Tax=Dovyalis caffra TaxID=77055 RepID=A0AAV1R2Q6_9ROSI|nr:unnamed protein product [Dovyalis caffra]
MSGYLPEEVMQEILLRLPTRTLLKCTSVCKSWYSLIKSRAFIADHRDRSIFLAKHDPVYLLRTFSREGKRKEIARHTLAFIIWNPLIKKYSYVEPRIHGPTYSFIGFGYDHLRDDYKLMRMANFIGLDACEKDIPRVELYLLNEGSWRSIAHEAERYMSFEILSPAFVNGVLHWTAFEIRDQDGGEESSDTYNFVLGFDMIDEAFCKILLPSSLVNLMPVFLSVLAYKESSIALCQTSFNSELIHVWVMKEYGVVESWIMISLIITPQVEDIPRALTFRKEGLLLELNHGWIFSWDPSRQLLGDLALWGEPMKTFVGSYVESLVLLDRANATSYGNDSNAQEASEAASELSRISQLSKRRRFPI